jgi:two-component system repressor protein LuxO
MQALYRMIETVGQSKAPVFILGESGTGKELCAEALHALSPRGEAPMLSLNCAAIPRELMESEIFGHVRGAFSGATADRNGAAQAADGGTLFLDELCEMDINLQAKLLRLLQTGEVRRVGETAVRRVDLRIICATNRDPHAEMEAGRLREDLFYRLFVIPIELPPLRERGADVLLIAHAMVAQYAAEEGKKTREISPEAQELLMAHHWPGNVRELLNVLHAAVIFTAGNTIEAETVAPLLGKAPRGAAAAVPRSAATGAPPGGQRALVDFSASTVRPLAELESEAIARAMTLFGGNMGRAAKALGINPSTLYRKLKTEAGT